MAMRMKTGRMARKIKSKGIVPLVLAQIVPVALNPQVLKPLYYAIALLPAAKAQRNFNA